MEEFKIYEEKGKQIIERISYPRFKGEITFGKESDIENIEMIDHCLDVSVLASMMQEAGEFIMKNNKRNDD